MANSNTAVRRTTRHQVYAATTDHNLHAYHLKGRRDFSIKMPALATQLEVVQTRWEALAILLKERTRYTNSGRGSSPTPSDVAPVRSSSYSRSGGWGPAGLITEVNDGKKRIAPQRANCE